MTTQSCQKYVITIGVVSFMLWGLVTWMSLGVPEALWQFFDTATLRQWTQQWSLLENGFYYDVRNNNMPTVIFIATFFVLFLLYMSLVMIVEKNPSVRASWIIGFAILFRLVLLPGELIHENDIYRYLWDGKSAVHGVNPYPYAPADVFMHEKNKRKDYYDAVRGVTLKHKSFTERDDKALLLLRRLRDDNRMFYDRIGHWQVPTIYPPVAQLVFGLTAWVKQDSLIWQKFVFFLFDIGVMYLIVLLLRRFRLNEGMVVVYAWSPLVLKEFPNSGHYDPVVIFFTMLSVYLFTRTRFTESILALAAATLSKFFSGVFLLLYLRRMPPWFILYFVLAVITAYVPFFVWGGAGAAAAFEGLHTYHREWSYNASIFSLFKLIGTWINPQVPLAVVKMAAGVLYAGFLFLLWMKKEGRPLVTVHKCFLAVAGLFVLSPVADPWYFCWVIPFLCLFPYRSWLLLSGLLILSYLNFHSDFSWVNYKWVGVRAVSWMIYIPFYVYVIIEWLRPPAFKKALLQEEGRI